jgi:hypothetical protein
MSEAGQKRTTASETHNEKRVRLERELADLKREQESR